MFLCSQSTNLAGLAVSKFPHMDLSTMYKRILRLLEKLPKDYAYRTETEKIVQDRLKIVKEVGHNGRKQRDISPMKSYHLSLSIKYLQNAVFYRLPM